VQKPRFCYVSELARRLLIYWGGNTRPRRAAFVGVGHAARPERRDVRTGSAEIADRVESPVRRQQGGTKEPVRPFRQQHDVEKLAGQARSGCRANIAGHHERAAGGARPCHDGLDRVADHQPHDALKDLFAQIDADSDGKLSKSEFENALGAGGTNLKQADRVFGKLDKDGNGAVSLDEMMSALKSKRRPDAAGSGEKAGSHKDPLMQALEGASSTSVTNSDGSVTTSLTYADGSKVTMTSAAASSASSAATSSYNFIEQMIQRQAQAISSAATGSLSVSV
jgi:hypothetical protein